MKGVTYRQGLILTCTGMIPGFTLCTHMPCRVGWSTADLCHNDLTEVRAQDYVRVIVGDVNRGMVGLATAYCITVNQ